MNRRSLKTDSFASTLEPKLVLKNRGMSRNKRLMDAQENSDFINRRSMSVLCASIVSTDGDLSTPFQLGVLIIHFCFVDE